MIILKVADVHNLFTVNDIHKDQAQQLLITFKEYFQSKEK